MRKGDRISYQGQSGTVVETKAVTPGMVDLRMDGENFVRRAPAGSIARLNPGARPNPTYKVLRAEAKRLGVRGYSRMDKPQLMAAIASAKTDLPAHLYTARPAEPSAGIPRGWVASMAGDELTAAQRKELEAALRASPPPPGWYERMAELQASGALEPGWATMVYTELVKPRKPGKTKTFKGRKKKDTSEVVTPVDTAAHQVRRGFMGMRRALDKYMLPLTGPGVAGGRTSKAQTMLEQLVELKAKLGMVFDPGIVDKISEERRDEWLKEQVRTHKKLWEAQQSADRAARIFKPATGRVTGMMGGRGQPEAMAASGAGVFMRPDPPRLARDGKTMCGNAIDGTAYYMAVSSTTKQIAPFVTWDELYTSALDAGMPLSGPVLIRKPTKLKNNRNRDTMLPPILRSYMNSEGRSTQKEMVPFLVEQGWVSRGRTIAGFEVSEGGTWRPVPPGAELPAGSLVRVVAPSLDLLNELNDYFEHVYAPQREAQGFRMFEHRNKAGQVGRVRNKRGKSAPGPEAADVIGGRAGAPTYVAEEGLQFSYINDARKRVFPRFKRTAAIHKEKLARFMPYGPHKFNHTGAKKLPLLAALLYYSDKVGPKISKDVAKALLKSGMVLLTGRDTTVSDEGDEKRSRRRTWVALSPEEAVMPGDTITVVNEQKAQDPFFSWLPVTASPKSFKTGRYSECLSMEDKEFVMRMNVLIRGLQSLLRQMAGLKLLIDRIRGARADRLPQWDVHDRVKKLAKALVTVDRQKNQLINELRSDDERIRRAALRTIQAFSWYPTGTEEDPPPLSIFRIEGGRISLEEFSPVNIALDFGERIGMYDRVEADDGDVYTENVISKPGRIRTVLRNIHDQVSANRDLGAVGLQFLSGEYTLPTALQQAFKKANQSLRGGTPKSHPLDDFYYWIQKNMSSDPSFARRSKRLEDMRAAADVSWLTRREPVPRLDRLMPSADRLRAEAGHAAWDFGREVRIYSIGGRRAPRVKATPVKTKIVRESRTPTGVPIGTGSKSLPIVPLHEVPGGLAKGRFGPERDNKPFALPEVVTIPRLDITIEEQLDRNDVITTMLTDVFEQRQLGDYDLSGPVDDDLHELLLLIFLYYDMAGMYLAGPLGNEITTPKGELNYLADKEKIVTDLLGGRALGATSETSFTLYMTYNPVLFEMARLYWPSKNAAEKRWKGVLAHPKVLRDVDTVGRYGAAARLMQLSTLTTGDEDQVANLLMANLSEPVAAYVNNMPKGTTSAQATLLMVNEMSREKGPEAKRSDYAFQRMDDYDRTRFTAAAKRFNRLWPIGVGLQKAYDDVEEFVEVPYEALAELKLDAAAAFPRLLSYRDASMAPSRKSTKLSQNATIQRILKGKAELDPELEEADMSSPERKAHRLLRAALSQATGIELYAGETDEDLLDFNLDPVRRRKAEIKALKTFQTSPGKVRMRTKEGTVQLKQLPRGTATGVYDKATVRNLERVELSLPMPPGEREYAGQTNTPWLMRERVGAKKAVEARKKGASASFAGQPDIYQGSVLAQVEQRRVGVARWIERIDQLVEGIETELGIA